MALAIGARGNFHFGATNTVGIGAEYGIQKFTLDLPEPTPDNAQVPDVDYRFIRPNVVGRFGIADKITLLASLGYLYIMSAGEIVSSTYFPGGITSASGFDLGLGVGWAPFGGGMKGLEIRPMLGWRRIGFTFKIDPNNPDPADPYVATGAHDDYFSGALMIGYRL
jgi:hypothetical protein